MHPSTELARPPGVDSKHRRLSTGYWPIAFAAVGCAVVITIAFETQDLSHKRAARERGKSAHEKIIADNSLMSHVLSDRRRELTSIESKEKYHQQILAVARHELEKAQRDSDELVKTNKSIQDRVDAAAANLAGVVEQVKTLEPDRREAVALQAQLEELNRQLDERRKMIGRPAKPVPRSRAVQPAPLGSTDSPSRGAR